MRFAIITTVAAGNNDDGTMKLREVAALETGELEDELVERLASRIDVPITDLSREIRTVVRELEAELRAKTVALGPQHR